jgi:hypothetical protein
MTMSLKEQDWEAGKDYFPSDGHCTVMKASHHASASSGDTFFLATVRPRIVLMSCGPRLAHHGHPTPQAMFRCSTEDCPDWDVKGGGTTPNTVTGIYVTEVTDTYPVKNKVTKKITAKKFTMVVADEAQLLGDIVLRPIDESVRAVRAADAKTSLDVQVYGTGDPTVFLTDGSSVRPMEDKNPASPTQYYPIGPVIHKLHG